MSHPIRALVICLLAVFPASVAGQTVIYVDADATGANDGTSWQNAFTDLQDGIAHATSGMQIWVAEGTYRPAGPGGDRTASFVLRPGGEIYGGFLGNETSVDERPTPLGVTTLSGDLLGNDGDEVNLDDPTRAENSFHVVTCAESESEAESVLDGLTVASGNANGSPVDRANVGGGLYCIDRTSQLSNSSFVRNSAQFGGGIALTGGKASLAEVRADSNYADLEGAGLYVSYSNVTADRLQLHSNVSGSTGAGVMVRGNLLKARRIIAVGNRAVFGAGVSVLGGTLWLVDSRLVSNEVIGFGAAMYADASSVLVANTIISGNDARQQGGGIWSIDGELRAVNVTIVYNRSGDSGGGVFVHLGSQRYDNVILSDNRAPIGNQVWGNTNPAGSLELRISTSLIEGGLNEFVTDGGGNVFDSPVFVDTLGADQVTGTLDDCLSLREGSPGIDLGDNEALPADSLDADEDGDRTEPIPFDISGNPRVLDGGSGVMSVDAGAFEYARASTSVDYMGLEIPDESGVKIEVYPNPLAFAATIELSTSSTPQRGELAVFDIRGRQAAHLFNGVVWPGRHVRLHVPNGLSPGFYTLVFHGDTISATKAIIKTR